jgi:hypothetical protein
MSGSLVKERGERDRQSQVFTNTERTAACQTALTGGMKKPNGTMTWCWEARGWDYFSIPMLLSID